MLEPRQGGDICSLAGLTWPHVIIPATMSSLQYRHEAPPRHGAMCRGPPSGGFYPVGGFLSEPCQYIPCPLLPTTWSCVFIVRHNINKVLIAVIFLPSHPNCVFLSVEKQKSLGYRIHDFLPYKSYARKNLGYLYAIQHGAKIIYETDDDNSPTGGKITFFQQETGDFFVYRTDSIVVNPYEHFGQSTIWPRGYPLDRIADPPSHRFIKCQGVDTSIQQGIVNGDPDVDAIFRLTRKDKDVDLKVEFDAEASPVLLPPKTMAPFNSQNTLFMKKALWAMLIPTTVTFRVCDIWRGYWAQRLLWDVGSHLSFFPPNAIQFRNAHNYLIDFIDEKVLYHDAGRLVEFLINWKSDKPDFFSRALDLSIAMVEQGFWQLNDAMLTEAWLADLISVGYEMPAINTALQSCINVLGGEVELLPQEKPSSYLRAGSYELKT